MLLAGLVVLETLETLGLHSDQLGRFDPDHLVVLQQTTEEMRNTGNTVTN